MWNGGGRQIIFGSDVIIGNSGKDRISMLPLLAFEETMQLLS